ncbi:cytochrome p450 family [Pyrenophora teres f. maculata]|nr:cytochrome p450 family [Pyrenophora teres f. maculata]
MHSSILLGLWVSISFIIYKIVSSIITSRRHAANTRRLGCLPASKFSDQMQLDIFNIRTAARIGQADIERCVPQYIQSRVHNACEVEGKTVSTFYANFMGSECIFIVEPRNIQAILATQFKDFGLGELRNKSFSPLLGGDIFSSDGEQSSHARTLLRPQFARDQVGDLDLNKQHVQHMMRALSINSNGWTDVTDLQRLFFRLTLDSATEFLFGEVRSRDTTLPVGGPDGTASVYLKKGMQAEYSVYAMHRRKDLWGEDADEFRPERFEGRKGGWEFLSFNGGPRICMGQQFALTEAGFAIVRMVQRFEEIEGVGNSWEPVERGGCGYTRHAASLSACPADSVKVRMKEAKE